MNQDRTTDRLVPGDELEPLDLLVTEEFNESILQAVEDLDARYLAGHEPAPMVHPALLIVFSNLTRSPSFRLAPYVAAVQTHDEVRFRKPARVGDMVTVTWRIADTYEKRGRLYQVIATRIVDQQGDTVLTRRTTNTFMGGVHPGA